MHNFKIHLIGQILIALALECISKKANVLIFGGNGFIGSECAYALLARGHNLTLVSRGSTIYDFETRVKPRVHHIKCDRYQGLHTCTELLTTAGEYDVLLDFSAYYAVVIEDVLRNLRQNFKTYMYISTDSVYEVSVPSKHKISKETDAVRYENPEDQEKANHKDSYGHHKFQGEELLVEENKNTGLQYIIFRLSDVLGPRDTTLRWWTYQAWFEYYGKSGQPMLLPKSMASTPTSYVYVKDIAKVITNAIEEISEGRTTILNDVYNLGFPEHLTLRKLLNSMQEALGIQGVEYNYVESPYYLYPSVTCGPIDISKAQTVLNWTTTPWTQAVKEMVSFYREAICLFPKERNEMLEKLQYMIPVEDFAELRQRINSPKCPSPQEDVHTEL